MGAKSALNKVDSTPAFALAVTDVRKNRETGKIEYKIEGAYDRERWSAWLRYSQLRMLMGRSGPEVDGKFPGKSSLAQWVGGADDSMTFVDERRRALNAFLREAVPNKGAFEILAQVPQARLAMGVPEGVKISESGGKAKVEDVVKEAMKAIDMSIECASHARTEAGGDGWKLHNKTNDGIMAFLKTEGDFTFAMGSGPLNLDKKKAFEFLLNVDYRKDWDEFFKFSKEIQSFKNYDTNFTYPSTEDPFKSGRSGDWEILALNIARSAFSSPAKAMVSERDSVCASVCARRRSDGAYIIALRSIQDPRVPEGLEGFTRARVMAAAFLFEDQKDGKPGCICTSMGLVDPNGNIPKFVINMVAPQRCLVTRDIQKAMDKNGY